MGMNSITYCVKMIARLITCFWCYLCLLVCLFVSMCLFITTLYHLVCTCLSSGNFSQRRTFQQLLLVWWLLWQRYGGADWPMRQSCDQRLPFKTQYWMPYSCDACTYGSSALLFQLHLALASVSSTAPLPQSHGGTNQWTTQPLLLCSGCPQKIMCNSCVVRWK